MSERRNRNFDDLLRDADQRSDKALYPYLKVHIFGPYQDHCYSFLEELKLKLQSYGFEKARICDDRGNEPPEDATKEEKMEFWWQESREFIENSDIGIFVFLDHIFERPNLSSQALEEAWESENEDHKEINSSVVGELFYWLTSEDKENNRTLLIFEEGIYDEIGSLIPGVAELEGVDYEIIENECIDIAVQESRQRCMNWAMNELRQELRRRHSRENLNGA